LIEFNSKISFKIIVFFSELKKNKIELEIKFLFWKQNLVLMFLNNTEAKLYTFHHNLKIFGNSAMDFYLEFQVQSSFFAGASSSAFFGASSAFASGGARALE